MTAWAAGIAVALVASHGVRLLAAWLTVRSMAPAPPAEFRDLVDAGRYRRSQAYARERARFGMLASTVELAVALAFWWAGGFGWLDGAARGLGLGPVPAGVLFLGALALAGALLGLPFALWSTFVIEQRFGFNRTRLATFVADRLKGALLAMGIGGPLLASVLWLFETAGPWAWLWAWALGAVAVLAVQFVAPAWLLPLFSRFAPLPPGPLRDAILGYGRQVDFPLADVQVVDGSRRSTKANAFFTGFGRQRRIALFDTLIASLDVPAIVGVVAHEVGHAKLGHVPAGIAIGVAQLGVWCFLLHVVLGQPAVFAAFGISRPSPAAGLAIFGLLLAPVELVSSVLLHAWSRRTERAADRFAVATTGDPLALARGLKRLSVDSLANLTPHPFAVLLDYSHPPVLERVRALERALGAEPR